MEMLVCFVHQVVGYIYRPLACTQPLPKRSVTLLVLLKLTCTNAVSETGKDYWPSNSAAVSLTITWDLSSGCWELIQRVPSAFETRRAVLLLPRLSGAVYQLICCSAV